jgi:hypothetical protein
VPIGNALNKGLTLRMNQASVKRHLPRLIEHIQAGRLKPSEIITHRIPLEDVSDAYHIFSSKLDNCIKPVLIPPIGAAAPVPGAHAQAERPCNDTAVMSNQRRPRPIYVEKTDPGAQQAQPPAGIQGWGADLDPADAPRRADGAHAAALRRRALGRAIEHQPRTSRSSTPPSGPGLTPVYGTAQPPPGLSGLIRAGPTVQRERPAPLADAAVRRPRERGRGLIEDLAHGHVPNIFKEMGGPAEWRYNREGFIRKAAVTTAVVWCGSGSRITGVPGACGPIEAEGE